MSIFWIYAALLLLLAAVFFVWPLWRARAVANDVARDATNLAILRDQLAELQADFANGLLSAEAYQQGKRELEARVLEEVGEPQAAAPRLTDPHRLLALALVLLLPALVLAVYFQVGNPRAIEAAAMPGMAGMGAMHGAGAIAKLEQRVAENPQDVDALVVLARSYMEQERYADAARTFEQASKLVPDEAVIWADYADALAMTHGQLAGAPTRLLEKALALDPDNMKALALSGTAAMERGDYAQAIRHWERLLKLLPTDDPNVPMLQDGLRQAREFQAKFRNARTPRLSEALPPAANPAVGRERIRGSVSLSPALRAKVAPGDTLFILARAAEGPKMPLAILRRRAADLPLDFELDDSLAMMPEMKLSAFDRVVVVARISKSGDAMPQTGDLEGMSGIVQPGKNGVRIIIDREVSSSKPENGR